MRSPTALLTTFLAAAAACAAEEEALPAAVTTQVDTALRSVVLLGAVLVVLILLAVAVMVYRKAFVADPAAATGTPTAEDALAEAAREERQGNFIAAAARYDAAGEKLKAAECWEKVKDFSRAAECYEAGGELEKAAQLYVRSGGSMKAAAVYMQMMNYMEAAKIFRNKGDHLRAAQALELYGNKVAAARAYSSAGNHARAARLLEAERMYAEAAEAYLPLLGEREVTPGNADRHGTFAALLALAGDRERAIATYRRVLAAAPGHLRAMSGLQALLPRGTNLMPDALASERRHPGSAGPVHISPEDGVDYYEETPQPTAPPAIAAPPAPTAAPAPVPAPAPAACPPASQPSELAREIEAECAQEPEDPLKRVFTLRDMIRAGRMEPRYSMRLWVQIMRALADRHRAGAVFGSLAPDSIYIDMENNVRIEPATQVRPEYVAPEVQAGIAPQPQADVYSMGAILFELVTGSVDQIGKKRPAELFADIPGWLDELIARCTEKNLALRYRTTEEVSAALLKIKNAAAE